MARRNSGTAALFFLGVCSASSKLPYQKVVTDDQFPFHPYWLQLDEVEGDGDGMSNETQETTPIVVFQGGKQEDGEQERDVTMARPRIDRFLQSYVQYTSSAYSQDRSLKIFQYSLWFLSRCNGGNSHFKNVLLKLSTEFCWARYINRLFGLPTAVEAVRSGGWGPGKVGKLMAWAMIGYYPLEHMAFVRFFQATPSNPRTGASLSAWSCRFWFAYIVLDLIRGRQSLRDVGEQLKDAEKPTGIVAADDDKHAKHERQEHLAKLYKLRRVEILQLLRNVFFLLPSIHWSLPNWDVKPWLSPSALYGLMFGEAIVCMYQGIHNFRAIT